MYLAIIKVTALTLGCEHQRRQYKHNSSDDNT